MNIHKLALLFNGRASKDAFPCCAVTGTEPRVTYQIFKGGKIVISGAGSEQQGLHGLQQFVSQLSDLTHQHIRLLNFQVQNIVAFGGLPFLFDQQAFFQDHQVALAPPKRYMDLAPDKSTSSSQPVTAAAAPTTTRGKKRKNMKGKTFSQFKSGRFRGLQFFPEYPSVIILYDTGRYVVTGTNDPDQILRIVNCIDWSKYKLADDVTLEEYRAKLAANHRNKLKLTLMGGLQLLDNTKLFSSVLWQGFEFIKRQEAAKSEYHHA